ncbi:hypothetical protein N9M86_05125 [Euryarchaeota archaeon]|nr:hypothetical protein [Euryarchaeota archaeon]MDA8690446.1 hypothetical protein [Euryarchaeota archaeon]MDA8701207.1 hypothetical protein [Euryarchaeota archaeon]MDC0655877.1 hypothetical protein [Candidatus Poseidoniaceae archaeon]
MFERLKNNQMMRGLILFSVFRAFYGAGILVVTYFLSTSADAPLPVSIGFLLFSMVFSRWLFKRLKSMKASPPHSNENL